MEPLPLAMPEPSQQPGGQGNLAVQEANGVHIMPQAFISPFVCLWGTSSPPHLVLSFESNSTPAPGDGAFDPDPSTSMYSIFLATVTGSWMDVMLKSEPMQCNEAFARMAGRHFLFNVHM